MKIRTRFAPSPTGFLHVGGLRTALYNYLVSKRERGQFLLRIEDTDQERYVEGAEANLIKSLKWAHLSWDEGPDNGGPHAPYRQSERTETYRKYTEELLQKGKAYRCFCTKERLEEMRSEQEMLKKPPMYDGFCRSLSEEEINKKLKNNEPFVVRQKIEKGKTVILDDLIRGKVSFGTDTLDDQVLLKSDNFPTYHLANVVDDHLMEISHVIRGEEWLPSTPKHLLLYSAFGWEAPKFSHLPLLLNKEKRKLSKREGHVAVEEYMGDYLPEAVINFVALLGWHPKDDREIFSLDELVKEFSLERVQKAGAIFDIEKLDWFNWQWRKKHYEEGKNQGTENGELLFQYCEKYLPEEWKKDKNFLKKCLITAEEKALKDSKNIKDSLGFYFKDEVTVAKELIINEKMGVTLEIAKKALLEVEKTLNSLSEDEFKTLDVLKAKLLELAQKLGMKNGQILWPLRCALTGEKFSPGAFEVAFALGKERTLARIGKTLKSLEI